MIKPIPAEGMPGIHASVMRIAIRPESKDKPVDMALLNYITLVHCPVLNLYYFLSIHLFILLMKASIYSELCTKLEYCDIKGIYNIAKMQRKNMY
jgi:hypothetical protein